MINLNSIKNRLSPHLHRFNVWLEASKERRAIFILVSVSVFFCLSLLIVPVSQPASDDDHDHNGHGEGEESHGHHEHEEEVSVRVANDVMTSSGILLEGAKSTQLSPLVTLRGQITENQNRSMNVKPRFAGIVKSVHKDFGDQVRKGETLVVIESANTRSAYSIRSAMDGIVADKGVVAGSFVPENESIFRVVDLSTIWFQGKVSVVDAMRIKTGFRANVRDRLLDANGEGHVIYTSPTLDEDTQSSDVRIELKNGDAAWRVGSFAEADILLDSIDVSIAVRSEAIQEFNGQKVVFIRNGEKFAVKKVQLGRSDKSWTEIVSGIKAGETYVAKNSFLVKAEILKSSAAHEH